jgi:hypothetical protein
MNTFEPKDRKELERIIGDMSLRGTNGMIPSGAPTGKAYSPWEIVNTVTSSTSYQRILTNLEGMLKAQKKTGVSKFSSNDIAKSRAIAKLERQINLVQYAWGYFEFKAESAVNEKAKSERINDLKARISEKNEENMSVKDMEKELNSLLN